VNPSLTRTAAALAFSLCTVVPTGAALAEDAPAAAPASPHTFTGNFGVFNQYIFRGLSETNRKPALQGGFDYAHESGFYAGLWGSNVSWFEETNVGTTNAPIKLSQPGAAGAPFSASGSNSNSLELDFYGGYKFTVGDIGVDLGLLQYYYPGTYNNLGGAYVKPDTLEGYGALSWQWLTFKYSRSTGDAFGVVKSSGSTYLDLTAAIPLGESGVTLTGHVGRQTYAGHNGAFDNNNLSYTDYKVGLAKEWLGLNWQAFYTTTNAKGTYNNAPLYNNVYGRNIGDSTFTIGVQKLF
jgi:uncharacterized protein (TIGR02001 family)